MATWPTFSAGRSRRLPGAVAASQGKDRTRMSRLAVAGLAVLAALVAAAPAGAAPWSQYRNDPAGDAQSTELGSQSGAQLPRFPLNLPPRNQGLNYLPPGSVVVTNFNVIVVADGFTVSAYTESGRQLWAQNLNPDNNTQGLSFVTRPALSASGATIYVMLSEQDPGGNNDPSILYALSTATGATRWTTQVGNSQPSSYVTVDPSGNLYVATGTITGNDEISGASVQAFTSGGVSLWTTPLPGGLAAAGVVLASSGNVYVATSGGFGP